MVEAFRRQEDQLPSADYRRPHPRPVDTANMLAKWRSISLPDDASARWQWKSCTSQHARPNDLGYALQMDIIWKTVRSVAL